MVLTQVFSSLDELDKLFQLCRKNGVFYIKLDSIEFRLSESLPIINSNVIMEESAEDIPESVELDKTKLADLKRMRQQQNVLKQLFNDI